MNEFISDQTLAWVILAAFYVFGIAPGIFSGATSSSYLEDVRWGLLVTFVLAALGLVISLGAWAMTTIIPMVAASV